MKMKRKSTTKIELLIVFNERKINLGQKLNIGFIFEGSEQEVA